MFTMIYYFLAMVLPNKFGKKYMYNWNILKKLSFLSFIMVIYKSEVFLATVNTFSSILHCETHLILDLNGNIKAYN